MERFLIVDFQWFNHEKNKFFLKEISILTHNSNYHAIVKCPQMKNLPSNVIKHIAWVTKHYHGLKWEDGYKSFSSVRFILNDFIRNNSGTIYVKGHEKVRILKSMLWPILRDVNIVNIETKGCKFLLKEQFILDKTLSCAQYKNHRVCSQNNVRIIERWLKEYYNIKKPKHDTGASEEQNDTVVAHNLYSINNNTLRVN